MHPTQDFHVDEIPPHVLYRDRDFDWRQELPPCERAIVQDLELETLIRSMAGDNEFLFGAVRKALLCGLQNDEATILYRQEILKDCLHNPAVIVGLYNLAFETIERTRRHGWGISSRYPSSMLYNSTDLLEMLVGMLQRLRGIAEVDADRFKSAGFTALFVMLKKELSDDYLASIQDHLAIAKFPKGISLSAELGSFNESTQLVLREAPRKKQKWFERILSEGPPGYTFHLHERDEAGARIVSAMRTRGISRVAITLTQSADHVLNFFKALRMELGFYIGCLNLHRRLAAKGEPVCFPTVASAGQRILHFSNLYDVCLSLHTEHRVVGNTADANGKSLIIITGANQGGKSTFLRSIGLTQLMMQCGMFVGAEAFEAEICPALFTHYKREEDASMRSGKFDEEMARMNEIVGHVTPNSMVLFNESFAATNEREGSEIARQIVRALIEKRIRVCYVTHLYEFARHLFDRRAEDSLFLRAERTPDGARTFRLLQGEPLETSYGEDLYRQIFDADGQCETKQVGGAHSDLSQ